MKRNFAIGQAVELVKGDNFYDLHNCYDFGGIAIESGRRVRLWFTPNEPYGKGLKALSLEVHGVDYLELSGGFGVRDIKDLDRMGFKAPGDSDLNWLMEEHETTPPDHFVFQFFNDDHIRIHGERMLLVESA